MCRRSNFSSLLHKLNIRWLTVICNLFGYKNSDNDHIFVLSTGLYYFLCFANNYKQFNHLFHPACLALAVSWFSFVVAFYWPMKMAATKANQETARATYAG